MRISKGRWVRSLAAAAAAAAVLSAAAPAGAAPKAVTATAGPVALPNVPVSICVNDGTTECNETPPATSVTLSVSATFDSAATTLPTITSGACSNGQGVALVVNTGSAETMISGSATVTVNGTPTTFAIPFTTAPPGQTVIVSACAAPGVGVPPTPTPTPTPDPTALLNLVTNFVNAVLGLLGGLPPAPAPPV